MRESNEEIKRTVLNRLAMVEATHTYAIAIKDNKMVKAAIVENADEVLPLITYCELNSKSHGAVYGVRIHGTKANFDLLKEYAREIIPMCSVEEFERTYVESKKNGYTGNRGNLFEDMFAQFTGGKQNESKTAKCTECGDVNVNGEEIQVKYWNATVTTEPQVNRFYAEFMARA